MEETTPVELIDLIKPNIVVKGKDWEGKEMPESEIIFQVGAELRFSDYLPGLSTSNIIEKVLKAYGKE